MAQCCVAESVTCCESEFFGSKFPSYDQRLSASSAAAKIRRRTTKISENAKQGLPFFRFLPRARVSIPLMAPRCFLQSGSRFLSIRAPSVFFIASLSCLLAFFNPSLSARNFQKSRATNRRGIKAAALRSFPLSFLLKDNAGESSTNYSSDPIRARRGSGCGVSPDNAQPAKLLT